MALVKYNNNSISSVTALDSLPAGGLNLLATNTITSGVSSSSFTSNINSTYDTYIFKLFNIHPATIRDEFQMNFSIDGGSNYNVTKTTNLFFAYIGETHGDTAFGYDNAGENVDLQSSTAYQTISTNVGNGSDEGVSGDIYLFSPSNTNFVKHFITRIQRNTLDGGGGNYCGIDFISGYGNTTSAVNAVDFKYAGGNIDSGIIKMYGLSKS